MSRRIRTIVVGGEDHDRLVLEALKRGGWLVERHERVVDATSFREALQNQSWDLVISEWSSPTYSALRALDSLRELHRPIPLVVVLGRIGEEAVADAMRAGACDVVLLDNLARLDAVIRRDVFADRAERSLRDVLKHGLIDSLGAIGVVIATYDGQFLDANDAFLRLVGYSRDDLLAGKISRATVSPPERASADAQLAETLKTSGKLGLLEKEYIRKDGVRIPVLVSGTRLDGGNVVAFIVDVSEHKRVEAELRSVTSYLDSIVENIPLMVFVKDAEHLQFERINKAGEELLGRRREDLLGKGDYDFFPKEQADFFRAKDRETLAGAGAVDVTEEPVATPRGERWVRTLKIAIRDESGTATHLLGISEDITPRREMAEALRRAEERFRQAQKMEAMGMLAGGVAHDFNNLLSVILSYAETTEADLPEDHPVRVDIAEIAKAGRRAAELTKQLLAFSRHQVVGLQVLNLNDALVRMDKMLRRVLEENVELIVTSAPSLWNVSADPAQVDQIVMNLVVNARDAMRSGGRLTIETANVELDSGFVSTDGGSKTGPHVLLAVTDTGAGIEERLLGRIFEPFYTSKTQGEGTGLGLSTVYGIVQQSGGSIQVSSKVGVGTTFKVYLPRSEALPVPPRSVVPPVARAVRETGTILVVEDEEQLRRLVCGVLRRRGYVVLDAAGPADAILISEQHPGVIDLLLTDVVMPRMNGLQLAERLAVTRPAMKVVFMSGYTGNVLARNGVLEPGEVLLQKPLTPDTLLAKVADVLAPAK